MTLYEILEVNENASYEVVKAAYKTQATKYHPDNKVTGNNEKMQMVNDAFEILSNPEKRKEYDEELRRRRANNIDVESRKFNNEVYDKEKQNGYTSKDNINNTAGNNSYTSPKYTYSDAGTDEGGKKLKWFFRFPFLFILATMGLPHFIASIVLLIIRALLLLVDDSYKNGSAKLKRTIPYAIILLITMLVSVNDSNSDNNTQSTQATEVAVSATETTKKETTKEAKKEKTTEKTSTKEVKKEKATEKKTDTAKKEEVKTTEKKKKTTVKEEKKSNVEIMADGLYSKYYPTYIVLAYDENMLLNKNKSMKVYLDGELLTEMKQGENNEIAMILKKGEHTLKINSGWFNSDTVEFEVGEDQVWGNIDNLYCMKMGYKSGNAKIMEFFGSNIAAKDSTVLETNTEIVADILIYFAYKGYKPKDDFQEVIELFDKKYGYKNTDIYKLVEELQEEG